MDEMIGKLHYKGDIRAGYQPQVAYSPRYGVIVPAMVEYDEESDRTTVGFVDLATAQGELGLLPAADVGQAI